jgi:hypothetical protein
MTLHIQTGTTAGGSLAGTYPNPSLAGLSIASKTGAYTLTATDNLVLGNVNGGGFTLTLPDAAVNSGKLYSIKKTDSSSNTLTINTTSSQTIDGSLTATISVQYVSLDLISDGSNWQII